MELEVQRAKFSKEFYEVEFHVQDYEKVHLYSIDDLFKMIKQRGGTALITVYEDGVKNITTFSIYDDKLEE